MQEIKPDQPVPERPKKRKQLMEYLEEYRESIIADYQRMMLKEFYERWAFNSATWTRLKKKWEVPGKGRGTRLGKGRGIKDEKVTLGTESVDSQGLTERERYLILVGYRQAVQEILSACRV